MDDTQLGTLSLTELEDLQARIHAAVRARIRAQQAAKKGGQSPPPETAQQPAPIDLARERDAWLARRR